MTGKVRVHAYVTGKVQGVYYRQNTKDEADKHRVTGWVRNLQDGRVEAVFEGDEASVNKLVEWCRSGPPRAQVHDVDAQFEKYTGEFSDFSISY
ncbi:MAG TPA: acylphosphatase [Nitrososphaera sp.]|nr:acylphosphatase [Nitrososphaera sp.]